MRKGKVFLSAVFIFLSIYLSFPAFGADKNVKLTGPYDTMRDYLAAIEARGRLLRINQIDQDKYEGTAFVYRMLDKMGTDKAPAVVFEKVKINGQVMDGPVFANIYPGWDTTAMIYGLSKITDDQSEMYRAVRNKLVSMVEENGGQWKKIKPVTIDSKNAPCKEVVLKGDDIDITKFPWFKNNPGDAGQYINTPAVFMEDPMFNRNVGTYRIQVKGKNKIGVNPEKGQHGYIFIKAAEKRGEKSIPAAIALGVDPIIFSMACTKVAALGEDELDFAGGLKGKPVELVKCETSNIMVPAQAEMIIEGDIPVETEEEGPYAEMYGYQGEKHQSYTMNIKAITYRKNPIIVNDFTGVTHPTNMIPWSIGTYINLKKILPNLVDLYDPREAVGISVLSIEKRFPGQGISAGEVLLGASTAKVAIVVDKDVDVTDMTQVLHAVATRWQPYPGSLIINHDFRPSVDPSTKKNKLSSKIVIDATRQFPEEGGPDSFAPLSRNILQQMAPDAFGIVDKNWQEYWKNWKK
ncbi:MAG: UbiD family decarboxylase [Candidatus Schekmanbacteria bacterium]|nr:UbiD family decarboxylase [Candidatus Schekmanbacteria bacterium]